MKHEFDVYQYWRDVLEQKKAAIPAYFVAEALVNWHNTNEQFTVGEFVKANCAYPGSWDGDVERVIEADDTIITVVHVYSRDQTVSFHVTSFIRLSGGKIAAIDEYWGDDGPAPAWRQELNLGREIR